MSQPPRIAVDLRSLVGPPTGIARYTRELLGALLDRGEYRWLGLAHREPRDAEHWRERELPIETQKAPLGVAWQQLRLPRRLAAGDVDLFWSPLFTLPSRLRIPAVVSVHDLVALLYPETHRFKTRWSLLPFLERSLNAADAVVTFTNTVARQLAFHFPTTSQKVHVVPHGVGSEFRPAEAEVVERIRNELSAPSGYLLYVGTIEPRKNLDLLLDAWEAADAESRSLPPLLIAGPYGWQSKSLMRRLQRFDSSRVRALGEQRPERLVELYQGARLFLYPSLAEGFGMPPLEAMACGVPTLVADTSTLPEVTAAGALHLDPQLPGLWAATILRLLEDEAAAAELGDRGQQRAADFHWEDAAQQMSRIFRALL